MLFDLRGKRRRAVQVTYASLAALMAIGLVGAGIGSDVSGGVFDIFTGDDSSDISDANKPIQKRIDRANDRLKANPRDQAALIEIVRGHYSLAATDTSQEDSSFGDDGKDELKKASVAWKRYLALKPEKPNAEIAARMSTAYSSLGLNEPASAAEAAEIVATEQGDVNSYLQLVQYATQAGQKRKADLAAEKALELAPEGDRDTVKQIIEQYKAAPPPGGQGGTGQAPAPGGG